jgi:hypothetical protein
LGVVRDDSLVGGSGMTDFSHDGSLVLGYEKNHPI